MSSFSSTFSAGVFALLLAVASFDRLDGSSDRTRDLADAIVEADRVDMASFSSDVVAMDGVYDGMLRILWFDLRRAFVGMVFVLSKM